MSILEERKRIEEMINSSSHNKFEERFTVSFYGIRLTKFCERTNVKDKIATLAYFIKYREVNTEKYVINFIIDYLENFSKIEKKDIIKRIKATMLKSALRAKRKFYSYIF